MWLLHPSRFLKENRASVRRQCRSDRHVCACHSRSSSGLSQALVQKPPNGSHQMAHPHKAMPTGRGDQGGLAAPGQGDLWRVTTDPTPRPRQWLTSSPTPGPGESSSSGRTPASSLPTHPHPSISNLASWGSQWEDPCSTLYLWKLNPPIKNSQPPKHLWLPVCVLMNSLEHTLSMITLCYL